MQIKYSETAFRDLEAIENFLLYKWNETVLINFGVALENCIRTIIEGVVVFQKYEDTPYHKILITRHNTLIYRIENDTLHIVRILQNFQNPDDNYESLTDE